jgi:phenylpropionate dioxygenase-like ring-hydroxylating dioxygenase large terminal subunit
LRDDSLSRTNLEANFRSEPRAEKDSMNSHDFLAAANRLLAHFDAGTTDSAATVLRVSSEFYSRPDIYALEVDRVFKRLPLALAFTCELPVSAYKAMTVANVPVLIVRGKDGTARAFVNSCAHRGVALKPDGCGAALRFTCPYHGWTYDDQGKLTGVADSRKFGTLDEHSRRLKELPCEEVAGLIFVQLNSDSATDVRRFLGGMLQELEDLDLASAYFHGRKEFASPNWKITREGYLEGYHFAAVHPTTIAGRLYGDLMLIDAFGDHIRLSFAALGISDLKRTPAQTWKARDYVKPTWLIFPNLAIAPRADGAMVTQLFPGPTSDVSVTIQNYIFKRPPRNDSECEAYDAMAAAFQYTVVEEDYPLLSSIQQSLNSQIETEFRFERTSLRFSCFTLPCGDI